MYPRLRDMFIGGGGALLAEGLYAPLAVVVVAYQQFDTALFEAMRCRASAWLAVHFC